MQRYLQLYCCSKLYQTVILNKLLWSTFRTCWDQIQMGSDPICFFQGIYAGSNKKMIAFTWDMIQVALDNYPSVFTSK